MSDIKNPSVFALGEELSGVNATHFLGKAYLSVLLNHECSINNVTFEPGSRNDWHIHNVSDQIIVVTSGEGWYQEEGKPARLLKAGDIVDIPMGVNHWHGATSTSWFSHLAIKVLREGMSTTWCGPVTEAQYEEVEKGGNER